TAQHLAMLTEHGATPHHRRSFAPVRNALLDLEVKHLTAESAR
ncbi:MAG: ribonuclease HII, partial [Mixta calida]|nr:ribonuclease HII [Mixta calida]